MCARVCVHKCKLSLAGKVLCNLWRAMCVRSHVITSYTHEHTQAGAAHALLYILSLSLSHYSFMRLCVCACRAGRLFMTV